jgi:hypothetical protein
LQSARPLAAVAEFGRLGSITMMTASLQNRWEDCKRRQLWYRVVLYGFVPLLFISGVVSSQLAGSDAPFLITVIPALLATVVVIYRLAIFECPRCRRAFFSRSWYIFQPHKQECVHCGLSKWSKTDETTTA